MKKDEDVEIWRTIKEKQNKQIFKQNPWEKFKEFLGLFFIAVFLLICIFGVLFLGVILIENPLSLAILLGTILLIIIWLNK
jgi:ABC-type transport system involved in cytochrome bd biosynthesis fused ATPase/permease subunit